MRGRRQETIGDTLLHCRDMTGECGVGSQAEDSIHPVGAAPVETLRTGIMAVRADELQFSRRRGGADAGLRALDRDVLERARIGEAGDLAERDQRAFQELDNPSPRLCV